MQVLVVLLAVLGLAGLVGLIVWAAHVAEKKRRAAFGAWADAHGFAFSPDKRGDPALPFSPFGKGHSRFSRYHCSKIVPEGVPGLDRAGLDLFEYHYAVTTHNGKTTTTTHYWHACALLAPGLDLGHVQLRDESWADRLVQAIGFDDIDLEDPEFSSKFVVKAKDRAHAYALLDHAMMRWLAQRPGWRLETAGQAVLIWKTGAAKVETYEGLMHHALGFLRQIPRVLVNAERAQRGLAPLIQAGNAAEESRKQRPGR